MSIVRSGPKPKFMVKNVMKLAMFILSAFKEQIINRTYSVLVVSLAVDDDRILKCGDCIVFHMDIYLKLSIFNRFV